MRDHFDAISIYLKSLKKKMMNTIEIAIVFIGVIVTSLGLILGRIETKQISNGLIVFGIFLVVCCWGTFYLGFV